jgi:hypothetical protein
LKTPNDFARMAKLSIVILLLAVSTALLLIIGCSQRHPVLTLPTASATPPVPTIQHLLVTSTPVATPFPSSATVPQSTLQVDHSVAEPFTAGETREVLETRLFSSGYKQETRHCQSGSHLLVPGEEIDPVSINTTVYHTVLYHRPESLPRHRLLIYETDGKQQTLLYDLESDVEQISSRSSHPFDVYFLALVSYEAEGSEVVGWHDMNKDGLLELAIFISDGSNSWTYNQIQVLQLHPDKGVVNLTLSVPSEDELELGTFAVDRLEDIDGDGIVEWIVTDSRFEGGVFPLGHAGSPGVPRIYAWDGDVYRNASTRFSEYYQPIIDDYQASLYRVSNNGVWDGEEVQNLHTLLSLLMALENAGMLEEGQAIVETYGADYFDGTNDSLAKVWRYFVEVFGVV